MKRFRMMAAAMMAVGLLAAPAAAQRDKNTIILGSTGDIKNFNIALRFDASWFPSTLYFERLVTMDYGPEFKISPQLAKSWTISEDGKTYTFELQQGVTWHDGKPFTSADVKATYDGIVANKTYAALSFTAVESVETPDPHKVVFKLKEPSASFLFLLSIYPRTAILPKHLYEGTDWNNNPANMKPVGTGPYKFERHEVGQYVSFVRNESYWGTKPEIERVILKVIADENVMLAQLRAGEIHGLNNPPPLRLEKALDAHPQIAVDAPPGPMIYAMHFNVTKKPFDDVKLRQALAYAIDRDELAQKATFGIYKPARGTYVQAITWAFNDKALLPAYDPSKAAQLLDAAGYTVKGGTRLPLEIWVSRETDVDAAQIIREQLRKVNIDVQVNRMEDGLLRQRLDEKKFDAYIYGNWWGPDPSEWEQYLGSTEYWNKMGYKSARVDELFKQAKLTIDPVKRAAFYKEIQEIQLADMPRIPLFDSGPYSFAHRTELKGWFSEVSGFRMDMRQLRWAQ